MVKPARSARSARSHTKTSVQGGAAGAAAGVAADEGVPPVGRLESSPSPGPRPVGLGDCWSRCCGSSGSWNVEANQHENKAEQPSSAPGAKRFVSRLAPRPTGERGAKYE